jgi:protein-S-isoprenylcysteine O-methyltransferase Ste14
MSDDRPFQLALLAVLLILLPVGVYHRLKSRTREKLDRRQEGWFMLITLRLAGFVGWLALLVWLIKPGWIAWAALPIPVWLRWVGAGLLLAAGVLLVWTFRSLGQNLTDTVVTRQRHTLITTGPYRWVRHPFYTSAALMIPATTLVTANWLFLAFGGAVFGLLAVRTDREEANLIARFGDDYRNYMKRTGRFLPRRGGAIPSVDGKASGKERS